MTLLPANVRDEVRYLLRLSQDEAGNIPYKDLKTAIIKLFAPKPQDSVDRALKRVLTGRPSKLAKDLIEDLCKCKPALNSPCCANIVLGHWRRHLPTAVRNAIADKVFNKDTYQSVLDHADEVFSSNKPEAGAASVAAVTSATVDPMAQSAEVAAIRGGARGNGRGGRGWRGGRFNRGGRGNRGNANSGTRDSNGAQGGNQSQGAQGGNKGPKHPDGPPDSVCQSHHTFGKSATFCRKPLSCPWKNFIVE